MCNVSGLVVDWLDTRALVVSIVALASSTRASPEGLNTDTVALEI
jgi:hypothetical protein